MGDVSKYAMIVGAVLVIGLLMIGGFLVSVYNGLVSSDQSVQSQWGNVESQYQRRIDLIPNLVEVAKAQMNFEQGTLLKVTEARTAWLNAGSTEEKINAGNQIDAVMPSFIATLEAYPNLRSVETNAKLMDQLEGTENRISVERMRYNEVVNAYNTKLKVFPNNLVGGMFGFKEKTYFKAAAGAENAPKVNLG